MCAPCSTRTAFARLLAVSLTGALLLAAWVPARADLTPDSKEVKDLIAKAVKNFESENDQRSGAQALYGLTLLKSGTKPDHPAVKRALDVVSTVGRNLKEMDQETAVYTIGLSIIFLVELDPEEHRDLIQAYLDHLVSIQKKEGGWGYANRTTGDTSMTQYGVLAMWEASRVGFQTPDDSWERVTNWLLRTQDPSGAWGYQGNDPGGRGGLVPQPEVRHSMAAAGLGSLYICADQYGYRKRQQEQDPNVPSVLKQVSKEGERGPRASNIDWGQVAQAMARGEKWMDGNYKIDPEMYIHYYLYAFERYQSFRELTTRSAFSHPKWYDDGVAYLKKSQTDNGSWAGTIGAGPDTAFAVLFLLRSSQKSIEKVQKLGAGTLVGGRGLPAEGEVSFRFGQAVTRPLAGPAEDLLKAIEDPSHPDYLRAVEGLEEKLDGSEGIDLGRLTDRLRRLVSGQAPEARAAAIRALSRTRDMDHVPLIITALNDSDVGVFLSAEEGLQFMSRTFRDRDAAAEVTAARRSAAIKKWKAWYRSIRPDAKFED